MANKMGKVLYHGTKEESGKLKESFTFADFLLLNE